jgi:alkylhydroperoxidase family enzyme
MARIPYPDDESISGEIRAVLDQMPKKMINNMLAHSPTLAVSFLQMAKAQFTGLELPDRDREVLILTIATLVECEYEWIQHGAISEAAGVTSALRESIRARDFKAETLNPRDRVIVEFVAEVVEKPRVSDKSFAEVRGMFTSRETVEMIELVGFYWSLGRFCTVLNIELDEPDGLDSIQAVSQFSIR